MTADSWLDWIDSHQDALAGEWIITLSRYPSLFTRVSQDEWASEVHEGALAVVTALRAGSTEPLAEHLSRVAPRWGDLTGAEATIYLTQGKLALLRLLRRKQVCPAEELWEAAEKLDGLLAGAVGDWHRLYTQQAQAQLQQVRRYSDAILRVIEAATGTLDFDEAMHRIRTEIERVVPGSWVGYYIVEEQRFLTSRHSFIFPYPVDEFIRQIVETKCPQVSVDAPHDSRILEEMVRVGGFRSVLGVPMSWKDEVLSVILVMTGESHNFSPAEIELIQAMANVAALTVKNTLLFQEAEKLAIIEERMRLSREIHDELAQILATARLKISRLTESIAEQWDEPMLMSLNELDNLICSAYGHIRTEIYNLRAMTIFGKSFLTSLQEYVEEYRSLCGLDVRLSVDDVDETMISGPVQAQLMRIIQEALMNVYRHAGTSQAEISLHREGDFLHVRVEDSGHGFDPVQITAGHRRIGVGLQVMRERAESLGGKITIDSKPGQGTRVHVEIPLTAKGVRR